MEVTSLHFVFTTDSKLLAAFLLAYSWSGWRCESNSIWFAAWIQQCSRKKFVRTKNTDCGVVFTLEVYIFWSPIFPILASNLLNDFYFGNWWFCSRSNWKYLHFLIKFKILWGMAPTAPPSYVYVWIWICHFMSWSISRKRKSKTTHTR